MANIKKIVNASGTVSYKITVTQGRDLTGKQIRHYMTWTPDRPMTERQAEKAAQKAAYEFEKSIEDGLLLDNRQRFADYAKYVLELKERGGLKHKTAVRYKSLLNRINAAIGHMKLADIRPQHLNAFYANLSEAGISDTSRALPKVDIAAMLKKKKLSRAKVANMAGVAASTMTVVTRGDSISKSSAEAIAKALDTPFDHLFAVAGENNKLAPKTVLAHHQLIHTILDQAEKELLVPFNAASKATPPKATTKEANYFQPSEIAAILDALETEPLKWRCLTHLLLITGCRRGEILGLKWDRVDLEKCTIKIDQNLLYTPERGIYIDTPKTKGSIRYIKIPDETTRLLKEYRKSCLAQHIRNADTWNDSGFVFIAEDGKPMHPDTLYGWLQKFSNRHNLPHINPHAFRHSMASILIQQGQDIVSVSKRLGHAKVSTTSDIYAHVIAEADAESAEFLADVLLRKKA